MRGKGAGTVLPGWFPARLDVPLPQAHHARMIEPFRFHAHGRLVDFMRQADEPGLINLAAGVPGLEALPTAQLQAAFGRAFETDGAAMFAYHHPEGDRPLRDVLASRLQARGAAVQGDQIITTTGCTQALQVMLSVLLSPGDVVAVEAPAYYGMLELLSEAGARVLPIPVRDGDGLDPDEVDSLLSRWKPKCLIVCSALSNPSGATVSDRRRELLVEICRREGVRLIEDDIYGELVDGGAPRLMLSHDDGSTVSYVTSFSKSVSPGLRVGFCVPGKLHEEFAARKCQQDLHSSVVSEVALREFLLAGEMDTHLKTLHARNADRRKIALAAVRRSFPAGTELPEPRGGYMLWVTLPERVDLAVVRQRARERHVVFASGSVFYPAPPDRSCMRLNCAKASEEELVRGIEVLGEILRDTAPV